MRYARQIYQRGEHKNCRAMLLMDMVGDKDFKLTIPSNSDTALYQLTADIALSLGIPETVTSFKADRFHDDHAPFIGLGIPSIDLIDFEYGPELKGSFGGAHWHTAGDTIDKLSADSLQKCGNIFKHLLWQTSGS